MCLSLTFVYALMVLWREVSFVGKTLIPRILLKWPCVPVEPGSARNTNTLYLFVEDYLIHLSPASYKTDIGKQCRPRSDAAERGVWSGSTLFTLSTRISIKMVIIKLDTPYIGNGPVQRAEIGESTRHKLGSGLGLLTTNYWPYFLLTTDYLA